ncbi:glycosyltransferase family 2 protein [Ahrensia sp. R2A130]|uniref:glycosyltransferase family 2 protein n=1 Tax=Ahrensia sp. R2A130 TaxID=744979 RepID=UPI000682F069|nr:glycosyltransferase family 2 protein [Ahrensia sp. R2A130]
MTPPRASSGTISIITPMFNEEDVIPSFFERIDDVIQDIREKFGLRVELIINDNCSTDRTFELLSNHAKSHNTLNYDLRIFRFANNIGFQRSILMGFHKATGDAIVQIDADLQDPPEMIVTFIENWQQGYHVVYGVRAQRKEGAIITGLRKAFYRFMSAISADDIPRDAGDFRLVDKGVRDLVCSLNDQTPYLRGQIAAIGGNQKGISYSRDARMGGESSFSFSELLRLALDGISNHSKLPLRLAIYFSFAISIVMALLALVYFAGFLFAAEDYPRGFTTLVMLQLGSTGALAALLGIQGEYLGRIFNQSRRKPLGVIAQQITNKENEQEASINHTMETVWFEDSA